MQRSDSLLRVDPAENVIGRLETLDSQPQLLLSLLRPTGLGIGVPQPFTHVRLGPPISPTQGRGNSTLVDGEPIAVFPIKQQRPENVREMPGELVPAELQRLPAGRYQTVPFVIEPGRRRSATGRAGQGDRFIGKFIRERPSTVRREHSISRRSRREIPLQAASAYPKLLLG
jgi:hypothetical protein